MFVEKDVEGKDRDQHEKFLRLAIQVNKFMIKIE